MTILNESDNITLEQIAKIELKKDAVFICETCLADKSGNFFNNPTAIFFAKESHPQGSHYFGVFWKFDTLYICNAFSATVHDITGIVAENGDIIYSRYRHDYRTSPDESVWIDGGRDYTRSGGGKFVTLRIIGDKLTQISS